MTSKEQIRQLLSAELLNCSMYQIVSDVKQIILDEIARPNVTRTVVYTYTTPISHEDVQILKMCFLTEFGFLVSNISESCVVIDMAAFLT